MLNTLCAFAGPSRTTYQAKIIKPDGYPLEATVVNFRFTILEPAGCALYAETFSNVNMGSSLGLISFSLGSGVRVYPVSGSTFEQVFSNTTASLPCEVGGVPSTYSPAANDARRIVMQFNDGAGWQTLPAMTINAVPYAMYSNDSLKLSGKDITEFVQVASLPTCTASQAMGFNGASFFCITAGGSGSVSSSAVITALGYTPADGASVTALTSTLTTTNSTLAAVSSAVFSVSSTVSTLANTVSALTSSQWTTSGSAILYNSGNVGLGVSNPAAVFHVAKEWNTSSSSNITATFDAYGTDAPRLTIRRANGPTVSPTAITAGQSLGNINFRGHNGTEFSPGAVAAITAFAVENFSPTNMGSALTFATASIGGGGSAEKMRIDSTGYVGIGTSTPITALDVSGGVRIGTENATCAPSFAGTLRYNSGVVEYCNGTSWSAFGVAGAGVMAINGLVSGSQTFATGTAGNSPNIFSTGSVHTFNFPFASSATTTAGLISYSDYLNFSNKQGATSAAIMATLGYTPADAVSVTTLSSTVASFVNTVAASFSTITSSQWVSSGSTINYSSGNVGIGTSDPQGALHVVTSNNQYLYMDTFSSSSTLSSGSFIARRARGSQDLPSGVLAGDRLAYFGGHGMGSDLVFPSSGAGAFEIFAAEDHTVTNKGSYIKLGTTPLSATTRVERLRIDPNGNVGIGTTAPESKLQVIANPVTGGSAVPLGNESSLLISTNPSGSGVTGYFGSVWFGGKETSLTEGSYKSVGIVAYSPNDMTTTSADGNMLFYTTPVGSLIAEERMRIDSSGNVGIGTDSPSAPLHILTVSGAPALIVERTAVGLNSVMQFKQTSGSTYVGTDSLGNFAINNSANLTTTPFLKAERTTGNIYLHSSTAKDAKLNLGLGTSLVAPMKFSSGTLLTSPQSGTMEYDGFNYYLTDSTNTRRSIATGSSAGAIDNASNINSTGNITMTPTGSVIVSSTTASTNSTTGAFIVNGGAGISGALNVAGIISGSSIIKGTGFRANQGAPDAADSSTNGYAFGQDGDTGIFSPGSGMANGVLSFYSNNAERMRLTASGSLGIGTATPSSIFHALQSGNGTTSILVENPHAGNSAIANISASNGTASVGMFVMGSNYTSGTSLYQPNLSNLRSVGGPLAVTTFDSHPLIMGTTGTERLRIDSSGNVGIGTTAPTRKLSVVSTNYSAAEFVVNTSSTNVTSLVGLPILLKNNSASAGNHSAIGFVDANDNYQGSMGMMYGAHGAATQGSFYIEPRLVGTPSAFVVAPNGNVGIGTVSPAAQLQVAGSAFIDDTIKAQSGYFVGPTSSSANIVLQGNQGSSVAYWLSANSAGTLFKIGGNGGTEPTAGAININHLGNVGIGTTSPSSLLDVHGTANFQTTAANAFKVTGLGAGYTDGVNGVLTVHSENATGAGGNIFKASSAFAPNTFVVRDSGHVGIGVSSPTMSFQVEAAGGYLRSQTGDGGLEIGSGNDGSSYIDFHGNTSLNADYIGRIEYQEAQGMNFVVNGLTSPALFIASSTGYVGIGTVSQSEKLEVSGNVKASRFMASGSAPGIVAGAAAGTGPTVSISGSDSGHVISLTTGTATVTGILATVTFTSAYASAPSCVFSPGNANAAQTINARTFIATTATGYTLEVPTLSINTSTTFVINVICL